MKRAALQQKIDSARVTKKLSRRVLRSTRRSTRYETERMREVEALMATPFLRALPLLVGSGFLYKWECRAVALTSKKCRAIVAEVHDTIPAQCQVEIECNMKHENDEEIWPRWVLARGLQHEIPTQEFSRAIFQKLCDLKVAAESTERKKQKVRDGLPKWGVDFLKVHMWIWDRISINDGGIYLSLNQVNTGVFCGWSIRLDNNLCLWTWNTFRKWRKVYDYRPLWDFDFFYFSDTEDGDSSDDEEEWPIPNFFFPF